MKSVAAQRRDVRSRALCLAIYFPDIFFFRQKFSGEHPWRHLARENMEEWGASFPVVLDTIRVAVKAFAEGKVEFDSVTDDTNKRYIRYAPSFLLGGIGALPPREHVLRTHPLFPNQLLSEV